MAVRRLDWNAEAPGAPLPHTLKSAFTRFFAASLTLATSAGGWPSGGTNINDFGHNISMAQQLVQPPTEAVTKAQEQATQAVSALKSFIYTGSTDNQREFNRIYDANTSAAFTDALASEMKEQIIKRDPQLGDILNAYRNAANGRFYASTFMDFLGVLHNAVRSNNPPLDMLTNPSMYKPPNPQVSGEQYVRDVIEPLIKLCREGRTAAPEMPLVRQPTSAETAEFIKNDFLRNVKPQQADWLATLFGTTTSGTAEEKFQALASEVGKSFGSDDMATLHILKAFAHAYRKIEKKDMKTFHDWLGALSGEQKKQLGADIETAYGSKGVGGDPDDVIFRRLSEWKSAQELKVGQLSKDEQALKKIPHMVWDLDAMGLTAACDRSPAPETVEYLRRRAEYLQLRIAVAGAKNEKDVAGKLGDELKGLNAWLDNLAIDTTVKEPDEKTKESKARTLTTEERLGKLEAGLTTLESDYVYMDEKNPRVVNDLKGEEANPRRYSLYAAYILQLDAVSGRIFSGITPPSPDKVRKDSTESAAFLDAMRGRISARFRQGDIRDANGTWTTDYFNPNAPTQAAANQAPAETNAYSRIATLGPVLAAAFHDFLIARDKNGVISKDEKTFITATAAKLYSIEPLLVMKYFNAAAHLAEVCKGRPQAFSAALFAIEGHVDVETRTRYMPSATTALIALPSREIIKRLDHAFDDIAVIKPGSLAQFMRYDLLDRDVYIDQTPPHLITQVPGDFNQSFLAGGQTAGTETVPYPFPPTLNIPLSLNMGSRGTVAYGNYSGSVQLPVINTFDIISGAGAVGANLENYLSPAQMHLGINAFLPQISITPLTPTRLINEINNAFIPMQAPEFSKEYAGLGLGLQASGTKTGDVTQIGGGGLGAYVTPTGGIAGGFSGDQTGVFGGATMTAWPIGTIQDKNGKADIVGVNSAAGGYETLDDGTKQLLLQGIASFWNPDNPANLVMTLNQVQGTNNQSWMTARSYYITKEGQIYDLKGGANDFVPMLNYIAGYCDKTLSTPMTYAWNVENHVNTGGGVFAIDVDKTPLLAHFQSVPFSTSTGQEAPLLLEWTGAIATTTGNDKQTNVHILSFPGESLQMPPSAAATAAGLTTRDKYQVQDGVYTLRRVKSENDVTELTIGAGFGQATQLQNVSGQLLDVSSPLQTYGLFYKSQKKDVSWGGGAFYDQVADFNALAMLSQADEARNYVASISRIGETMYGSGWKPFGNSLVTGALGQLVEQLRTVAPGTTEYDNTLFRLVGFASWLKDQGVLVDLSRSSWFDQMVTAYNTLQSQVGQDPSAVSGLLSAFQSQWGTQLNQLVDKYYIGMKINKNFSAEFSIVANENSGNWTGQDLEEVYGRLLLTGEVGGHDAFARAFAAIPYVSPVGVTLPSGIAQIGEVGVGAGGSTNSSAWFNRFAADFGIVAAIKAQQAAGNATAAQQISTSYAQAGAFVQGALRVYDNYLEDSEKYIKLRKRYDDYSDMLQHGKVRDIPEDVWSTVCGKLPLGTIAQQTLQDLRSGRTAISDLTPDQQLKLGKALYAWFYDEKGDIGKEFKDKIRTYVAGSDYIFNGNNYWDAGAFFEYAERVKTYIIFSQRDQPALYLGTDVTVLPKLLLGLSAGITRKDFSLGFSATMTNVGPGILKAYVYGTSANVPVYTALPSAQTSWPEQAQGGVAVTYTVGMGGTVNPITAGPGLLPEYTPPR